MWVVSVGSYESITSSSKLNTAAKLTPGRLSKSGLADRYSTILDGATNCTTPVLVACVGWFCWCCWFVLLIVACKSVTLGWVGFGWVGL